MVVVALFLKPGNLCAQSQFPIWFLKKAEEARNICLFCLLQHWLHCEPISNHDAFQRDSIKQFFNISKKNSTFIRKNLLKKKPYHNPRKTKFELKTLVWLLNLCLTWTKTILNKIRQSLVVVRPKKKFKNSKTKVNQRMLRQAVNVWWEIPMWIFFFKLLTFQQLRSLDIVLVSRIWRDSYVAKKGCQIIPLNLH